MVIATATCQIAIFFDFDSGMFQRLDRMRKHAFGSMIVFGENNNNSVGGLWMWRGHELAFTVCISFHVFPMPLFFLVIVDFFGKKIVPKFFQF